MGRPKQQCRNWLRKMYRKNPHLRPITGWVVVDPLCPDGPHIEVIVAFWVKPDRAEVEDGFVLVDYK